MVMHKHKSICDGYVVTTQQREKCVPSKTMVFPGKNMVLWEYDALITEVHGTRSLHTFTFTSGIFETLLTSWWFQPI